MNIGSPCSPLRGPRLLTARTAVSEQGNGKCLLTTSTGGLFTSDMSLCNTPFTFASEAEGDPAGPMDATSRGGRCPGFLAVVTAGR